MWAPLVLLVAALAVASPVQRRQAATPPAKLHGKFLHLTDLHPDPFYKIHSSTDGDDACHSGSGVAGTYGAETSDCDSPHSLVSATFDWIRDNLRDEIDFIVWTGDNARHDNDDSFPRDRAQVLSSNRYVVEKFAEVFDDKDGELTIPIVPTFGNNDVLPHNILYEGPNFWLKEYTNVWGKFIPESQRHTFERGGWFWTEVIPNKLAVFSLNTMYLFNRNVAVEGCSKKSEPGFEHMQWLRVQLQFMRDRGMKAIMTGHVPPARTDSKELWYDDCWQMYTLWLRQYRDVVGAGLFGHMNIDHFMLQDTKKIDIIKSSGGEGFTREQLDDDLTIQGAADYLEELRQAWSKVPNPPGAAVKGIEELEELGDLHGDELDEERNGEELDDVAETETEKSKKPKKGKKGKKPKKGKKDVLKKIGGPYAERYQLTLVAPSVVPNYFPSLRVLEYNLTGLDVTKTWAKAKADEAEKKDVHEDQESSSGDLWKLGLFAGPAEYHEEVSKLDRNDVEKLYSLIEGADNDQDESDIMDDDDVSDSKKKKKHKKKPKKPKFTVPNPPTESSPPGPAYSPQTLTLTGYTQYFANITHINNDISPVSSDRWRHGKHRDKKPKDKIPHPKPFTYEVEYTTFNDSKGFNLKDMTVRSYLKLAYKIGKYNTKTQLEDPVLWEDEAEAGFDKSGNSITKDQCSAGFYSIAMARISSAFDLLATFFHIQEVETPDVDNAVEIEKRRRKHKKKKHHKKYGGNKAWFMFVKRAFVGTMDDDEIKDFEVLAQATSQVPGDIKTVFGVDDADIYDDESDDGGALWAMEL